MPFVEIEGVDDLSYQVFREFLTAMRLHRQLMIAALAESDNHPGQAICLRFLSGNDGITQRDLAEALHLARPTVSKMLHAMEKSGVIERRSDERDQRLTRVHLTAAGRELEAELRVVSAAYVNETISTLGEGDRRELARLLAGLNACFSRAVATRRDKHAARIAATDEHAAQATDEHAAQAAAGDERVARTAAGSGPAPVHDREGSSA